MATLTYKITENITLNGRERGSEITNEITSVNDVFYRIVSCPGTQETTVAVFQAETHTSDSAIKLDDVKYIRVTNLDDNSNTTLSLQVSIDKDGSADSSISILLGPKESFIMGEPSEGISLSDTNSDIVTTLGDLESIIAYPAAEVDIELFVAG